MKCLVTFSSAQTMLNAQHSLEASGVRQAEALLPYSVEGEDPEKFYAVLTLFGGLSGLTGALFMQWYASVVDSPLNVGGRPLNSWPAFIPLTFICGILGAALMVTLAFFLRLRLPWLAHPAFTSAGFDLSRDAFQLLVDCEDDIAVLRRRLADFQAIAIEELP